MDPLQPPPPVSLISRQAPPIPLEIAEPILTYHILLHTAPVVRGSNAAIRAPLNTLSRTLIPDVTRAALVQLWWYSLDDIPPTCTAWMLPMLIDLDTRGTSRRPLAYSTRGLCTAAARQGDLDELDVWHRAGLLSDRSSKLFVARHAAADAGPDHLLRVLEWWVKRKLPWGDRSAVEMDLVLAMDTRVLSWWKVQGLIAWPPQEALVRASRAGRVDLLEWWMLQYPQHVQGVTVEVVDAAVEGGQVEVLRWWLARFPIPAEAVPPDRHDQQVLKNVANLASRCGHAHVLDWWFEQILRLPKAHCKWSVLALDHAAAEGHMQVLDWWLMRSESHGFKLKYKWALDWASAAGRLNVLEWFAHHEQAAHHQRWCLNSANPCPLLYWPVAHARSISVACLDWRLKHGLQTRFSAKGMALLCHDGRRDVLDWITHNGIAFATDEHAVNNASHAGHLNVLDWWVHKSGVKELKYSSLSVLDTPHLPVLQWWADHAAVVEPEMDLSFCLCLSSHVNKLEILTWALQHSEVPETMIERCIELCIDSGDFDMLEHCLQTFPTEARKALQDFGLQVAIHHGQFSMVAFLDKHGILTPDELDAIVNGLQQSELSQLAQIECLAFLDWIRRHRLRQPEAPPFFVAQKDLDAARGRGDLGFRRWVKSRQVDIREHAFVDLVDELGEGHADGQFENGFVPDLDDDDDGVGIEDVGGLETWQIEDENGDIFGWVWSGTNS